MITPSHNPPQEGGFKYNPPNGGPAERIVTDWIEAKANEVREIVAALLAAEITARMGRDPGEIYHELTREFGEPAYDRVEASMRRASGERITCAASWRKPRRWSAMLWRRRRRRSGAKVARRRYFISRQ